MPCAAQLLQSAVTRLQSAGSDEPQANAEWLLACALNVSRTWVLANASREISPEDEAVFNRMLTRKEAGEPLSHIVGFQPFCGLDIRVTPDVLTPRPETEELAELAAAAFDRRGRYEFWICAPEADVLRWRWRTNSRRRACWRRTCPKPLCAWRRKTPAFTG